MRDLVSVIVPVYKVENYIRKCLDSIINQTYRELDIILVDDGSPDNCGKICDEYAENDSRIRVIHKENGGLSSARNAALDVIKGNWVICIDSDDYVHPDMIKRLYEAANANSAQISICAHYEEFEDRLLITQKVEDNTIVWNKDEALRKLVEDSDVKSYAWGKLYRADLFENVRYPDGRNYEDIATTYYLFDKSEKIVKIPDYLYYYFIRNDSISFNNSTAAWHKGCHASCLGQQERAEYFRNKGYEDLYQLAMAKLLPYLFSNIRSGYSVDELSDVNDTKKYIEAHRKDFADNPYISQKDKGLIPIYLKGKNTYSLYLAVKNAFRRFPTYISKTKKRLLPSNVLYSFELSAGKKNRVIYFELPCFDNLGDHAIAYVTESFLSDRFNETPEYQLFIVDAWDTDSAVTSLRKCILPGDIIVCQGGGNFGSLYDFAESFRRKSIKPFKKNRIVVMPQTIYYSDDSDGKQQLVADQEVINPCKKITLFARDAQSYNLMKEYFDCDVQQMHDVVSMYDASKWDSETRKGIVVCLRSDKESALSASDKIRIIEKCENISETVRVTDTCTHYDVDSKDRSEVISNKLRLLGSAELVITDRLHGMIFSMITNTPCIVLGNNHHKVYETYKTFKDCNYLCFANNSDELIELLAQMYPYDQKKYKPDYAKDIDQILKRITDDE